MIMLILCYIILHIADSAVVGEDGCIARRHMNCIAKVTNNAHDEGYIKVAGFSFVNTILIGEALLPGVFGFERTCTCVKITTRVAHFS